MDIAFIYDLNFNLLSNFLGNEATKLCKRSLITLDFLCRNVDIRVSLITKFIFKLIYKQNVYRIISSSKNKSFPNTRFLINILNYVFMC